MLASSRPSLAQAGVAAFGCLAVAVATLGPSGSVTAAAAAAGAARAACPDPKPVVALRDGDPVTARTVTEGTVPDSLTGEIEGVVDDGIGPGVDLIMVKLEGSRVTDADGDVDAGIWAGMSGSPVYAAGGRLIGAVAYSLSLAPSQYAGVTPAVAMYDTLDYRGRPARTVDVPARVERDLRASGVARASNERFRRLPMPTSVSGGFSQRRLDRVAERAGFTRPLVALGGRAGGGEPRESLRAGGNLTASLSYGDITPAGIGTVTAVCDDNVVGFGHPMLWSGPSDLTMHGAEALFIQPDTTIGSYKVANPSGPVGAIVQDRLAAIVGLLGDPPANTSVTSSISSGEGNSRDGTTRVSHTRELPFLTALHVLYNADVVYDGIRAGTGDIGWTIAVTREDGSITRIQREDLVADGHDLTIELIWGIWRDLGRIVGNRFEEVEVTDVDVTARLDTRLLQGTIRGVEVRRGGEWIAIEEDDRVTARAGATMPMRVQVRPTSDSDSTAETVRVDALIPDRGQSTRGHVHLSGGSRGEFGGEGNVGSFDDLVDSIESQPPGNSVGGIFHYTGGGGGGRSVIEPTETTSTVRGGFDFRVLVKR